MKILALDYGEASLGIALSDVEGLLARGAGNLRFPKGKTAEAVRHVRQVVKNENVRLVVLGLPLNMDGSRGRQAEETERFKEELEQALDVPVILEDERLTTVYAKRRMVESERSRKKRRGLLDEEAAVVLLQAYLDKTRKGDE